MHANFVFQFQFCILISILYSKFNFACILIMHANFLPNKLTTDHIEEKSFYSIQYISILLKLLIIIQAVFIASMTGKELGGYKI